jgi:hypothetical protein
VISIGVGATAAVLAVAGVVLKAILITSSASSSVVTSTETVADRAVVAVDVKVPLTYRSVEERNVYGKVDALHAMLRRGLVVVVLLLPLVVSLAHLVLRSLVAASALATVVVILVTPSAPSWCHV